MVQSRYYESGDLTLFVVEKLQKFISFIYLKKSWPQKKKKSNWLLHTNPRKILGYDDNNNKKNGSIKSFIMLSSDEKEMVGPLYK